MVTLHITYRDVRKAWYALSALASGQVMEGDKPYAPQLKIKTNLKIKRMLGSMRPLMEGMQEEEQKLLKEYPEWKSDGSMVPPAGLNEKLGEIYDAPCTVYGVDQLSEEDFSNLETAPTVLIGVLVDLGQFFDDGNLPTPTEAQPAPVAVG